MTAQQKRKQRIRAFMQEHYTDERLAMLLAHARDGKLAYNSCCCFIGISTSNHNLQGESLSVIFGGHYGEARMLSGAGLAEEAFLDFGDIWLGIKDQDAARRRILIPMIRAEMRRRERLRSQRSAPAEPSLSEQEVLS